MQIPSRWWVQIIPGFLLIVAIVLFLPTKFLLDHVDWIKDNLNIVLLPLLAILSYIAGLLLNAALILLVLPLLRKYKFPRMGYDATQQDWLDLNNFSNTQIVMSCRDGYENMVFWRTLLASCIVLCISILNYTYTVYRFGYYIIILFGFEVVLILVVGKTWWKYREDYDKYLSLAIKISRKQRRSN